MVFVHSGSIPLKFNCISFAIFLVHSGSIPSKFNCNCGRQPEEANCLFKCGKVEQSIYVLS